MSSSSSPPLTQYGGICIGLGGIKGIIMAGAIHQFWVQDQLKNLVYYSGSSAGSILASLMAIGYSPIELLTILCDPEFTRQFGSPNFMNLPIIYGFYPSSTIRSKMQQLYMLKLGYLPTFDDLYRKMGKFLQIPIYCLSETNADKRKIYCSPLTTPDMSVLDAVVCSCAIPIIFQKTMIKGKVYIDGGYTSTFPIRAFQEVVPKDCNILGVCLKKDDISLDTFIGYITNLLMVPLSDQDNTPLFKEKVDIIELSVDKNAEISSITFDLSVTQKMNLFSSGTKQAREILEKSRSTSKEKDDTMKEKHE